MNKYIARTVAGAIIFCVLPSMASAQVAVKKTPRKYDKLLTAVESFAKLNAQIDIREREFNILAPFEGAVIDYSNQLKMLCDAKCTRSVTAYGPKLTKFNDALYEANRRYQAMASDITEQNAALMQEIRRVEFLPAQLSKQKAMAALNQLNLENLYHYKAYATTYHSADSAMLSLAASSDLTTIVNSYATTTERLAKTGRITPQMEAAIVNLKNKVPDIRARIKALEDRRKSLVCTATLKDNYSVEVHCTP
jgi:septal ring factor EnvC (AmiA/AmiB activator)